MRPELFENWCIVANNVQRIRRLAREFDRLGIEWSGGAKASNEDLCMTMLRVYGKRAVWIVSRDMYNSYSKRAVLVYCDTGYAKQQHYPVICYTEALFFLESLEAVTKDRKLIYRGTKDAILHTNVKQDTQKNQEVQAFQRRLEGIKIKTAQTQARRLVSSRRQFI